jgi:hypothetical protein
LATSGVLAVLWLVFLPWLGSRPELRRQMEFFDRQGVDPSAMYYTDLELMPRVYARSVRVLRENRQAFYRPRHRTAPRVQDHGDAQQNPP